MAVKYPSVFPLLDGSGMYGIQGQCRNCLDVTTVVVTGEELFAYNQGALVQDAFPSISPSDREWIFISKTCMDCWADMLGEEDE